MFAARRRPPTILHTIDSLERSGGAEQQLVANLQHFNRSLFRHELAVISHGEDSRTTELPSDIRTHSLFAEKEKPTVFRAIRRLTQLIHDIEPTLIHSHLQLASLASRVSGSITGVPVVESLVNISHEPIRAVDNPNVNLAKLRAYAILDRLTMRRVQGFHAISEVVADSWASTVRLPASKMVVIPRAVDLDRWSMDPSDRAIERAEVRTSTGFPEDAPLIVAVGRIEPQKGHRYLVEAIPLLLPEIPDARCIIVGRPGASSDQVDSLIRQHDLEGRVKLVGVTENTRRFVAACDVFAYPSLFEGSGVALLEAMALGVPIVTTDRPPMSHHIDQRVTGLLTTPRDPQSIAVALGLILSNSSLAQSLARAAMDRARGMPTPLDVTQEHERWYQQLI